MIYNNYSDLHSGCFSCSKSSHFISECPMLKYIIDKEALILKNNYSKICRREKNYYRTNKDKIKYNSLFHNKEVKIIKFNFLTILTSKNLLFLKK